MRLVLLIFMILEILKINIKELELIIDKLLKLNGFKIESN